jgi:hypothetical protein
MWIRDAWTVCTMDSTMSQPDLNVASGIEYRSLLWDVTQVIKPVLSVARTPSQTESVQVHWRSLRMKHTTLSIPWPSAQNKPGLWPSTYPAPWAKHVPSSRERAHPYVPSWVTAEPSLQARNGEVSYFRARNISHTYGAKLSKLKSI